MHHSIISPRLTGHSQLKFCGLTGLQQKFRADFSGGIRSVDSDRQPAIFFWACTAQDGTVGIILRKEELFNWQTSRVELPARQPT